MAVTGMKAAGCEGGEQRLWPLVRLWWPFMLGHALEWYDYAMYGYIATSMRENFFRGSTLATWFGFSVTFLARPLGGLVLGRMADVFGRRMATLLSITGMIVATVGQGLLPSYECCGDAGGRIGVVLLLGLRFAQGISAGGELPAIVAYFVETAPRSRLGLTNGALLAVGVGAFVIANGVAVALVEVLGQERMVSWGWRLPYLVALPPGLLSLWGRQRLGETEEFLREQGRLPGSAEDAAKPAKPSVAATFDYQVLRQFFGSYGLSALLGFCATAGHATVFYVGLMWCPSHLKEQGMDPTTAGCIGIAGTAVTTLTGVLFSHVADVLGIGTVKLSSAICGTLFSLPLYAAVSANPSSAVTGFLCISLGYGIVAGMHISVVCIFCAELFPTHTRALGFALSYNLALALFGGLGNFSAEASLRVSPLGPGILLSAASLLKLVSVVAGLLLRSRGVIRLTHLRDEPYLTSCWRWPQCQELAAGKAAPGDEVAKDEVPA